MCCLTLCVPSPCEALTDKLSLWLFSPHPSNITWLCSGSLTGGTLCLPTHSSLPPHTQTHITFSQISVYVTFIASVHTHAACPCTCS